MHFTISSVALGGMGSCSVLSTIISHYHLHYMHIRTVMQLSIRCECVEHVGISLFEKCAWDFDLNISVVLF